MAETVNNRAFKWGKGRKGSDPAPAGESARERDRRVMASFPGIPLDEARLPPPAPAESAFMEEVKRDVCRAFEVSPALLAATPSPTYELQRRRMERLTRPGGNKGGS